MIGPSGCGKSTFLRCLNRLHETTPLAYAKGRVLLDGRNIYAPGVDAIRVRKQILQCTRRPRRADAIEEAGSRGISAED